MHFGYTGLLNFGQAGFMAVGAYGIAIDRRDVGPAVLARHRHRLLGAVVLALLLGVPTLRLRADYLAIVTIAAAEIIRLSSARSRLREYFGGSDGLQGFAGAFYDLNPFDGPVRHRPVVVTSAGLRLLGADRRLDRSSRCRCLVVWLLMRSPWGRVLKAIREDEDAVRSLGKNVYAYKMQSLILGGVIGALGGFIFAAAKRGRSSRTLRHRPDVLRLHRPHPRRRGPGARARRRRDDLLGPAQLPRHRLQRGDRRRIRSRSSSRS